MNTRMSDLEKARIACMQGDFQAAYRIYEHLLQHSPEDPLILQTYGRALYAEYDDFEKATLLMEKALRLDPESAVSLFYLAELYTTGYGKGYPHALPLYQRILELYPSCIRLVCDAHILIGKLYYVPSAPITIQQAIQEFQTAIALCPLREDAHNNLAMALAEVGDCDGAIKELKEAKRLCLAQGKQLGGVERRIDELESKRGLRSMAFYCDAYFLDWPSSDVGDVAKG